MAEEENEQVTLSEQEWKERLTPEQFHILRQHGTERAFSGVYTHPEFDGVFRCAGCGAVLFESSDQFDSGSGWPSFTQPVNADAVELKSDHSFGMRRTEVSCKRCGGHLGHVFNDGPQPNGERWCINSISIKLEERR